MVDLTLNQKMAICKFLEEANASKECHRCNCFKFKISDNLANVQLIDDGITILCAIVVCDNCGAMTFHAMKMVDTSGEILKDIQFKIS